MKTLLPLAALAAGFLVAPLAQAQTASNAQIVRTADLRLDTSAGAAKLDRRITLAARAACATDAGSFPSARNAERRCVTDTVAAFTPRRDMLLAAKQRQSGVELSAR